MKLTNLALLSCFVLALSSCKKQGHCHDTNTGQDGPVVSGGL